MADPGNNVCFVIMPFGEKPDGDGETIPFDDVYDYCHLALDDHHEHLHVSVHRWLR